MLPYKTLEMLFTPTVKKYISTIVTYHSDDTMSFQYTVQGAQSCDAC